MDGSFGDLALVTAAAAPIVVALVQGAKAAGITGSRWAVLVAMLCGVLVEGLIAATDMVDGFDLADDLALVILGGIVAGLAAAGIYSGGKAVAGQG